jgi:hypothetical protein
LTESERQVRIADDATLARWCTVTIAHRLTERIPEERVRLLRRLSRALREAEA